MRLGHIAPLAESRPRVLTAKFAIGVTDRRTDNYYWLRDDKRCLPFVDSALQLPRRALFHDRAVLIYIWASRLPLISNHVHTHHLCMSLLMGCTPHRRTSPEVLAHLEAENNYTTAVMAPTEGLQDALYEEMKARIPPAEVYPPQVSNPRAAIVAGI